MDKCILEKDKSYLVKVDKIEPKFKRPQFTTNNATFYNAMLFVTMKDGAKIMVEYPSPTAPYNTGVNGESEWRVDSIEIGIPQWIRCKQPSDIACVVEPCDPPGEQAQTSRNALPKPATDTIKPEERMNTPADPSPVGKLNNERLLSVATSYAKDLKVAEIGRREYGAVVTEQDIEDVAAWGLKIFNTMSEQLNF